MYKYIVYKTTNLINNKIYIGVHRTNTDINDGYIGCGVDSYASATENFKFHRAVKKYGYKNFKRETLYEFPDSLEGMKAAYEKESELVTEEFILRNDVYNMSLGGKFPSNLLEKTVYQFDLQGNYITYYKSLHKATEETGIDYRSISQVCLGKSGQAGGFY